MVKRAGTAVKMRLIAQSGLLWEDTREMDEKEILHHLKKCTLFDAVKQNEIAGVLASAGCIARSYGPGAIVAFRGDHYDKLLVILSGSVIAEFQDYQGKVLKVETLRQGEAIATAVLFSPDNYLPVTLTTDAETTIFEIPRNCILELMKTSSAFMEQMLYDIGNRLTILAEKLYLIQFSTIKQKLAVYFLDQSNKQGTESPVLMVTKETLAEIFGVARPSLSRCFSELTNEVVLAQEGRIIHILERDALEKMAEGE